MPHCSFHVSLKQHPANRNFLWCILLLLFQPSSFSLKSSLFHMGTRVLLQWSNLLVTFLLIVLYHFLSSIMRSFLSPAFIGRSLYRCLLIITGKINKHPRHLVMQSWWLKNVKVNSAHIWYMYSNVHEPSTLDKWTKFKGYISF